MYSLRNYTLIIAICLIRRTRHWEGGVGERDKVNFCNDKCYFFLSKYYSIIFSNFFIPLSLSLSLPILISLFLSLSLSLSCRRTWITGIKPNTEEVRKRPSRERTNEWDSKGNFFFFFFFFEYAFTTMKGKNNEKNHLFCPFFFLSLSLMCVMYRK
jgi:hypothetical protein